MGAEPLKILVTGASGFIGSHYCDEALRRGMRVWAGVRKTSSRQWLGNEHLELQMLDLDDPTRLSEQLVAFRERHGRWDYVVHTAGVTKCKDTADFMRVNYLGTRHLVETLMRLDMAPRLFVYLSSLSVLGAIKEPPRDGGMVSEIPDGIDKYPLLTSDDKPHPNTAYGQSKLMAEQFLDGLNYLFPYLILRPTGVYGPRERDYFLQVKSVSRGLDFAAGRQAQALTFVYVADLLGATFAAIDKCEAGMAGGITGLKFCVSDGETYTSRDFSDLVQKALGRQRVWHATLPLWLLRATCWSCERIARHAGRASTLNMDKYRIMKQRNWKCDITPMRQLLGYEPQWKLKRGVETTVAWYTRNKWL